MKRGEQIYKDYEQAKIKELSQKLQVILKQVKMYEIAKATGLKWDTINRIRKGKASSLRTIFRIERYLQSKGLML